MRHAACDPVTPSAARCAMSDAAHGPDLAPRAARFANRLAGGAEPGFSEWQRLRQIDKMVAGRREVIAQLVALLDARRAIDSELNGSRLGALAYKVGEARFDYLCDAAIPPALYDRGRITLPDPDNLNALGELVLRSFERSADALHLVTIALDINAAFEQQQAAA